jgi:hypothetical protein
MNRNLRGVVSTLVLSAIIGAFSVSTLLVHQRSHDSWSDVSIPEWQADVQLVQDQNTFWSHADGQLVTQLPEELALMHADQQFIQDVSALHLEVGTAPELLAAARGRLWHVGDRLYDAERLHELGLLTDVSSRINQSSFHPELIEAVTALNTHGLEAAKAKLPTRPTEPVWSTKTLVSDLMVWPTWIGAWLAFSILMLGAHTLTRNKEDEHGVYHHVMKKSGEPIGRFLLFMQMAPTLLLLGLGELSVTLVKMANMALAIARHPNSSEVRSATKALADLKKTGASTEQIQEAQEVLRAWTLYDPDQTFMPESNLSRAQRKQRDALAQVDRLRRQLTADKELDQLPAQCPKGREKVPS